MFLFYFFIFTYHNIQSVHFKWKIMKHAKKKVWLIQKINWKDRKCILCRESMERNIIQLHIEMKYWHMVQHQWTLNTLCYMKKPDCKGQIL